MRTPGEFAVLAHDGVETREVLVEAEHMPDSRECVAHAGAHRPGGSVNAQLAVWRNDVNRARPSRRFS